MMCKMVGNKMGPGVIKEDQSRGRGMKKQKVQELAKVQSSRSTTSVSGSSEESGCINKKVRAGNKRHAYQGSCYRVAAISVDHQRERTISDRKGINMRLRLVSIAPSLPANTGLPLSHTSRAFAALWCSRRSRWKQGLWKN